MSIVTKLVVIIVAAAALILPTFTPLVYALDVPSSVEILELTCGLEFAAASANLLDYGSIAPNAISTAPGTVSVRNTGNTQGELFISGTDWKEPGGVVTQMLVGVTHFDDPGTLYDDMRVLSSTPTTLSFLPPLGSLSAQEFSVKGVLETPGFSGQLQQTVIFSTEC